MTWRTDLKPQPDHTIHIWPETDLTDHTLTGTTCPCGPRLEPQPSGHLMVTHHSLDGRELTE